MSYTGKSFLLAQPYLVALSQHTKQHFDTQSNGEHPELTMQANTQEHAARLRRAFPGAIWRKKYEDSVGWWEYSTTLENGLQVRIYAVREAPKTCRAVMKRVTVEEQVPTAYEIRTVTKEVIDRWICDGEDE